MPATPTNALAPNLHYRLFEPTNLSNSFPFVVSDSMTGGRSSSYTNRQSDRQTVQETACQNKHRKIDSELFHDCFVAISDQVYLSPTWSVKFPNSHCKPPSASQPWRLCRLPLSRALPPRPPSPITTDGCPWLASQPMLSPFSETLFIGSLRH